MTLHIDEDPMNADWAKRTWDAGLPTNVEDLREFLKFIEMTPEQFKQSPIYKYNVDKMPWLKDV